jgi:hypothetical protein
LKNTNHIVHQKIALIQMRQAVLFCYLQILRRFLISNQIDKEKADYSIYKMIFANHCHDNSSGTCDLQVMRRTCAYDDTGNLPTWNDGTTSAAYTYDDKR